MNRNDIRRNMAAAAVTAVLLLSCVARAAAQQGYVPIYPMLELLVDSHKKQSDLLRTRGEYDTALMGMAGMEESRHRDYAEWARRTARRMGDAMTYVAFAADIAVVTDMAREVAGLEERAMERSVTPAVLRHPFLVRRAADLHAEFGRMTTKILLVCGYVASTGVGIALATQQQRQQFTGILKSELTRMRSDIRSFMWWATLPDDLLSKWDSTEAQGSLMVTEAEARTIAKGAEDLFRKVMGKKE